MWSIRVLASCLLVAAACTKHNPAYYPHLGRADLGVADGAAGAAGAVEPPGADRPPDLGAGDPADAAGPGPVDAAAPPDRGADVPGADLAGAAVPPVACGTLTTAVENVRNADGVVIDPLDGRLYLLTAENWVGRSLPGEAAVPRWQEVGASPATYGLALDSARARLYVLVGGPAGSLVAFDDIRGTPRRSTFVTGIRDGNDVTVGLDGSVYYTQMADRHVYRVAPGGGTPTMVTTSIVGNATAGQSPAALTMHADGSLWVGVGNGGPVFKLTLASFRETGRTRAGTFTGWANGLAFDLRDRLYVANYHESINQSVVRLEANGTPTTIAIGARFSSIAFGRAPLDCRDLYIADPYGPMRRVRVIDAM
jgi:hypothetical protein